MINKVCFICSVLLLLGCSKADENGLKFIDRGREVPEFNADSAFSYIQDQLNNGPRVPNTEGHRVTRLMLQDKLESFAGSASVYTQSFKAEGYDEELTLYNIIASFNPTAADRILLAAHWDTRPRSDMDANDTEQPIAGADDGGSGVAVLLELARLFHDNPLPIGVDIVLFDGEDYGKSGDLSNYFLGSRYWAENPPVPGYRPRFGILLDMVGAENAVFPKEQFSMQYAPNLVNELWSIAKQKGLNNYFLEEDGVGVLDDHYIINEQTDIPMIDIINHRTGPDGSIEFAPHWHTLQDDMSIIDKNTLQAIGIVLAELIYNRI